MAAQQLTVNLTAEMVDDLLGLGYPPATLRDRMEKIALEAIGEQIWLMKQKTKLATQRVELQVEHGAHRDIWDFE